MLNPLFNLSLLEGSLGHEGMDHQHYASHCSKGSFVPLWREELISCAACPLCCSSVSQRQFRPIKKGGADHLTSLSSVLLLFIQEAVLSHTKARSIIAAGLSLRRELFFLQDWLLSGKSLANYINIMQKYFNMLSYVVFIWITKVIIKTL